MKKTDFRREWKFHRGDCEGAFEPGFDDGAWQSVIVPHTWNADDMAPGRPVEDAYIGPAWYRKRFRMARPDAATRVFLLFEAIENFSEVWVDGKFLGGRDGGFLSFRLDITGALDAGEDHVVAVRADNSFRWGSVPPDSIDWERYGGMVRPVWLLEKGGAVFDHKSIRIETPEVSESSARLTIRARVRECAVRSRSLKAVHRVLGPDGREAARAEETIESAYGRTVESHVGFSEFENPRLWSPETPNLYRVESVLLDGVTELDKETNPLGFRWFRFDPDRGFSLNGAPMKLLGVDNHQEFPGLGHACPERFHRRDAELIKEAGLNFMRASHYPRNERFLDACDQLGVMVMEEQPFWHGSIRVRHGEALVANARRLMREMVEQHGNHPSIVCWNTVNEIMLCPIPRQAHPDPKQRKAHHRLPEEEWPFVTRVISAMNDELHAADPSRPTCMVVGGSWQRNEEAGATRLADMVGYNGGAMHARPEGRTVYDICKEADPRRVSIMTEGVLNDHPPMRADWQKELAHWEVYARHWSLFYEREWFCGGAMSVFSDYSAKGTYRNMSMMDMSRLPYEGYYFFKAMWTEEPMVHICCHWDWPGEEGKERRVVVFTNWDEAELFLNGESQGTRAPNRERWPLLPHPPLEWSVPYQPGILRVIAHKGDVLVTDARETSDAPAEIELRAESEAMLADGQDVAFITATIVDADGRRCYNAHTDITIDVTGAASLAGPGTLLARGGLARFAIRSDGTAGDAQVRASAEGLAPCAVNIPSLNL